MFSGIVTDVGSVRSLTGEADRRFVIETGFDTAAIALGASIACSGVCLTVTDKGAGWFAVDASRETLSCTTLADFQAGTRVNLERSLKVGDEIDGHLVMGHVDGTAVIIACEPDGESLRYRFALAAPLSRFVAPKGAIALDGVSLTVNEVEDEAFGVNIIPHTRATTTFGNAAPGARVNVEIDVLARYVARLTGHRAS